MAEALCLLPVFGAEYIVGVVLGCFLANLLGSTIVDVIFGTLATLLACLVTYKLRNVRFKGLAIAASLPPVLFNAVIIGIEIAVMFPDPTSSAPIWLACITNGISVGIGELISCTVLGVVLVKLIESNDVDFTHSCLNWMLETHGYPQRYDLAAYRELFGFPIEDYYRCAGFDFARHPYPELAARFMEHYNAGVPGCAVTAHAVDTLQTLARMGWQQAVLSASRRDYLIEQVSARGLQGFFTELLGLADIYGVSKVQLGTDYLRRTGIDPAACVMVGDTDHDAAVAAAIGATCVLYTGGHQSRARLEKASPYVIDDLAQLPALLETI